MKMSTQLKDNSPITQDKKMPSPRIRKIPSPMIRKMPSPRRRTKCNATWGFPPREKRLYAPAQLLSQISKNCFRGCTHLNNMGV